MNYNLSTKSKNTVSISTGLSSLLAYLGNDRMLLVIAMILVLINSAIAIVTPYFIGLATDKYIVAHDLPGLVSMISILIVIYIISLITNYYQMVLMGQVSQSMLYRLRTTIFTKIQQLPLAFFQQNRTGDLMSRINTDTDKLNQFLSESVMRFIGSIFVILGIGIFVLFFQWQLGLVMLSATTIIFLGSMLLKKITTKLNQQGAAATGSFSGQLQESLSNFKVIVAFDRRQYFQDKLQDFNQSNFQANTRASFINSVYKPLYDASSYIAQTCILLYGLYLISHNYITIGTLIAFLTYAQKFYEPLRILGTIVGNIQSALASWVRVNDILGLENDLPVLPTMDISSKNENIMEFDQVSFGYEPEKTIIHQASFALERGKKYAIVGPTGGGKSTLASLMRRLYDPTAGKILLRGMDIRTYSPEELATYIGFILQDALLFTGTVGENISYGNSELKDLNEEALFTVLQKDGLEEFLAKFPEGLATKVISGGENLSLGQKQLISFMRAVLRKPDILILDEATANIDTVTEQYLTQLLDKLAAHTTQVIIAHRLNTIKNADQIMFINNGHIEAAMDFQHAIHMLDSAKRKS